MFVHDPAKKLKTLGYGLHAAGLVATLAILAGGYYALLRAIDQRLADRQVQAAEIEASIAGAESVYEEQKQLAAAVERIEKRTTDLHQQIPEEPLEAEFLGQVSEAAGKVGLALSDYRPGTAAAKNGYSQIEVHLKCQGTYASLCGFLDRLASLPRLSHVVDMDVAASDNNVYPATITLAVFFNLKPKAAAEKSHG